MDLLYIWITVSVLLQVGYDNNDIPDDLSLIYVLVGFLLVIMVAYYIEVRRCASFIEIDLGKKDIEHGFVKYMYSMSVIIERINQDFFKDMLFLGLRSLLTQMKGMADFGHLTSQAEGILANMGSGRVGSIRPKSSGTEDQLL